MILWAFCCQKLPFLPQNAWSFFLKSKNGVLEIFLKSNILCTKILGTVKFFLKSKNFLKSNMLKSKIHCNNIFAIVQSTVSGFLKDSNTTVGVKNLLRWGSNRRPLVYKAGVFTIPPRNIEIVWSDRHQVVVRQSSGS